MQLDNDEHKEDVKRSMQDAFVCMCMPFACEHIQWSHLLIYTCALIFVRSHTLLQRGYFYQPQDHTWQSTAVKSSITTEITAI